jgi:hypothetical protein
MIGYAVSAMTPSDLLALIARTPGSGLQEESPKTAILLARLDDDNVRLAWSTLRATLPDYLDEVVITQVGTDADLDADGGKPGLNAVFRITMRKKQIDGQLCFLTVPTGDGWYEKLADVSHVLVAAMSAEESFTTYRARYQHWSLDTPQSISPTEALPDPRRYCTDFTQRGVVVADLRPWLLNSAPAKDDGAMFMVWRSVAVVKAMAAIADHLSVERDLTFHFSGPPAVTFALADVKVGVIFAQLNAAVLWVYGGGQRDAETRHLLLAHEWARSWSKSEQAHLGADALKSAQAAFNAFVKSGSKETLKAIAELRKGVVDEGQKISQRAQDLSGALWKDLAVASAPFVLKILSDSARLPVGAAAGGLALAAALFLAFSYAMQVFINRRYFQRQDEARAIWRSALSTVLSGREIEEYGEAPLANSKKDYEIVCCWVGAFYLVLIGILVIFGIANLRSAPASGWSNSAVASNASTLETEATTNNAGDAESLNSAASVSQPMSNAVASAPYPTNAAKAPGQSR